MIEEEQQKFLEEFAQKFIESQQPLDPEFAQVLHDNLWELMA
jgi:hypothetical protein